MQAAVGSAQLSKLNYIIKKNKQNKKYLKKKIKKNKFFEFRKINSEDEISDTLILIMNTKRNS